MKKALLIIAPLNFRDEEYSDTKKELERAGVKVTTACSTLETARGKFGALVKPDVLLSDVPVRDYDAVVFIGGGGAAVYLDDARARSIILETVKSGKILAAICMAPAILARAGVLKGVKATVFPDDSGELTANGADYTGSSVEQDGRIITGDGPKSAVKFGQTIARALSALK